MNSFTNKIFNKAHLFKLQRSLQFVFVLFFLTAFQKMQAQCPTANAIAPITVCSGAVTNIVLTSDLDPLTTYTWTSVQTNVVGATDAGGIAIVDTLTASDVIQGTVDYTVTPHANGCDGTTIIVSVAVNPIPFLTVTPVHSTICSGGTTSIALTSDVAGTTYTWTVTSQSAEDGATPGAGALIAQVLNTTGPSLGIAHYNIVPSASGCDGLAIDAKVTVRQLPALTLGANPAVCVGSLTANLTYSSPGGSPNQYSVDYDATANGLGFVDVVNAALPASPIVLVIPPGTPVGVYNAVVSVRNTVTGCPGASYPITITISAPIAQTIIGASPICIGTFVSWSSTTGGGTWSSATPGVATVGALTGVVTGVSVGTSVITYSVTVGGCVNTATKTVTVNLTDDASFSYPSLSYCQSGSASPTITGLAGGTFSSTAGLVIDGITGLIDLAASSLGTYTVTYTTNGPCPNSANFIITIAAAPTAAFSYTATPYCQNAANPFPTFVGGSIAGTFSSTAGLLFVSTATGQVDLGASTPGTYTVTNTIAAAGGCPLVSSTNTITINVLPAATISYPGSPFCASGTGSVTQTGQGGGSYSSTAGLVIDVVTGAINLVTSSPGTYTVTYSFSNGTCAGTATTSVTINAVPSATISYPGSPFCASGTGSVTQTGQGGGSYSSTAGLVIDALTGAINLVTSTLGTYTVTYSFSNGTCAGTATTSVTINALPAATISYPGSPFCASGTGSVTQTGQGGGSYSSTAGLVINAGTGAINLVTSTLGTYTVTYSFSNGTCAGTATASVTINAVPSATISYPGSPFCASGTGSVTQTGQGGGSYSSTAGLVINAGTGAINLVTSTLGTYTVTYSFSNGTCIGTATTSVTINAGPTTAAAGPNQTLCATAATLAANTPLIGIGNWSIIGIGDGLGSFVDATSPTSVFNGTSGITYILRWTISNPPCASSVSDVTIAFNQNANLVTVPQSTCSPATVNLMLAGVTAGSTPGLVYSYFTDAAATSIYATPATATAGTYYIVGTLGGGCSDTAAVTVTINPKPNIITTPQNVCSPGTADLTLPAVTVGSTGGLIFSYFSNAAATISYPTPNSATSGTYYIVGVTPFGCRDTSAVAVSVNPTPTVTTVPQAACFPSKVNLTLAGVTAGSTPGLTYTYWTNAAATISYITPVVATAGTYYIVGTIGSCTDTTPVTVTINPKPTVVTHNPAAVCAPGTVNLTLPAVTAGSTASLTFTYFTNAAATISYATPAAAGAGTYYIVGATAAGCTDTTAVTVTTTPKPVVTTWPQGRCAPATVDLTSLGVTFGSTGGLTYTYFTNAAATIVYPTPTTATTGTYYIVGTTAGGCSDTTAVTVTISPSANLVITNPAPVCAPATVDLTAGAITAGSTPPGLVFTYFVDAAGTNPYATPAAAFSSGTYYIRGTSAGCSDIKPVNVVINPKPTVNALPLALCFHPTVDLTLPVVTTGSTAGLSFTYFTNAAATIPLATPTAVPAGTYYIVGTVLATGCADTTPVVVSHSPTVVTTPLAQCAPNNTINLASGIAVLFTSPNLIFTYFTDAAATIPYPTPATAIAGTYYIVGTTADGCPSNIASVTFTVNPKPDIITTPQTVCAPSTVDLSAAAVTAGTTPPGLFYYYYANAAATLGISFPTYTSEGAGTYYIVGLDGVTGCSDTASVLVTVHPQPTVIAVNQTACSPVTTTNLMAAAVTLGSDPGLTFTYFDNLFVSYPTPAAATAGNYFITGTIPGPGGCSKTVPVSFTVNPKPTVVTTPQSICAPGKINLTDSAVTSGSTGGLIFTYFTNAAATIPYATPAAAGTGTYYIVGRTAAGCSDTTAVVVTINPKPNLITTPQSVCAPTTKDNLTLPGVTAGSTPGLTFTYFTDPGATSPYGTPTAATSGTYYIVGVTGAGCSDTTAVTFSANPKPILNTVPQSICMPAVTFDITQPASTAGSTPGLILSYFTNAGATIPFATPTTAGAGTYYIVGVTAAGCSDTTGITVTVNPKPTLVITDPAPRCSPASANITLAAITAGSTGGLTYSYYTNAGATIVYATSAAATAGTYYIVGNTIAGCSDTAAVNVIINSPDDASFSYSSASYCQNAVNPIPTVTGLAGGTFSSTAGLIFVSAVTGEINLAASTPGTYSVTYTTSGPCPNSAIFSVTITTAPGALFSYAGPYCQGGSPNPSPNFPIGSIAGTFSSTAGLVFVSTATGQVDLTASAAGTYTVTNSIAPSGSCGAVSSTASITINSSAVGTFSYTGSPYCKNAANPSPTFSGGGVAGTFSSTAGLVFVSTITGQIDLTASSVGTYTVTNTIAASGGCPIVTATSSITIIALPVATFSYTGTPYCQNAANPSPTFSGGGIAGTFSSAAGLVFVSTATGQVNLSASTAGTYTVTNTIAASGGCPSVFATSSITITPLPIATFSYTGTPYCLGAANPSPTFNGGGIAGTFSSTAGLVFVSTATGQVDLAASSVGTYTVTNTIAASGGCPLVTATSSITIIALSVATFSYTGTPYCKNAANPSPTFSGGGTAGTFSSTAGLVFVSTATGQVNLAASTAGTYTVTNTIAASGGCPSVFATSSITITPLPIGTFSYLGTPYCINAANPSPTFSGGGIAGTFSSTAGLVFVSTATGQVNLSASTPGTYTVTNTIAAAGGCPTVTATSLITITALPVGTFSYAGTPYCKNAANPSPTFSGGGTAGTFSSTAGLVFVSTATGQVNLAASTAGTYTVTNTIAAAGGCPAVIATSSITITPVDDASFSYLLSTYCQSDPINPTPPVTGLPGGTFSSTAGLVFVSTATGQINLAASTLGTYLITYTTNGPCPNSAVFTVTITLAPIAGFTYSGPYCQGGSPNPSPSFAPGSSAGTFSSTAGLVFVSVLTGQIDLTASTPGTYTVTNFIAASGGCASATATASVTITTAPISTFSYTGTPYCQNAANPSPTFSGGGTAGTFSALPAGLVFVSTATGQVNLAASTAGSYIVTNTIAASGGCGAISSASPITITALPIATFSYTGTPYCKNAANPSPTFSGGGAAGTFSSTAGLVFVSTATGQVDLTASAAGTYTVTNTIAAAGGCPPVIATSPITINGIDDASFTYAASTYCQSDPSNPSPTITGLAGGTFSSTAGLVFVSAVTGQINLAGSAIGTYNVTYTTSGPCPNSAIYIVTITLSPISTFSYAGPYCQGGIPNPSPAFPPGSSAGVFSSTAGLVFVSNLTGQVDLTASAAGTYTVTNFIAASGACAASTSTALITITASPIATFGYPGTPYCQDAANPLPAYGGGGGVAGTFSALPAGLVFVSTATGQVNLAASTSGTYTVTNTIAAAGGCGAVSATAPITITALPIATFSYIGSPYCQNAANPSPTFSGGGIAGTFSSTAGLIFVSTATGEIDLGGSAAGTYTVTNTIAASGGCPIVTATASITITPLDNASFGYLSSTYCQSDPANPTPPVTGLPGGTFSSTPGLVFISTSTGQINLAGSALGTYVVTYTTSGVCPNSAVFNVTITLAPSALFSYGGPYCVGGSPNPSPIFPPGSSAGAFSALPAGLVFVNVNTGQIDITASASGVYTVTNFIAASGACLAATATNSVTILALPAATISYPGTPYCATGTASVTQTGQAGGTYSSTAGLVIDVSTGDIDLVASTAGTYTVTYSFTDGTCNNTATTSITILALPTASISYPGSPYCATGTGTVVQIGQGGGAYTSSAGLVIDAVTGAIDLVASSAGTYTVTYTFTDGVCSNSTTASVTITALPTAVISYSPPLCATGTGNVTQTGQAGGIYTSTAGLVIDAVTGAINLGASIPGIYTVTYSFTAGSCANTTTTSVTILALPTATIAYAGSPYCATGTGSVTQTGQAGGTYSSTAGLVIDAVTGAIDLVTSTAGTYTVTYTFTDGTCSNTAAASVTILALPTASISYASPLCAIGTGNVTQTGQAGGAYTSTAGLVIDAATGAIDLVASALGTYTVTYSFTDGTCVNTTTTSVTIIAQPTTAAAGPDQIDAATCGLTSVTLAANTPVVGTGLWTVVSGDGLGTFVDATSPTTVFNGTAGVTYVLRWTISNAPCTASTDDVTITFNQAPTVADAGTDQTSAATCGLTAVTLAGNAAVIGIGNWTIVSGAGGSFVDATSPTTVFNGTAGTTYVLRWTISNICGSTQDDVTVTFNQAPTTAAAGVDQTNAATCGLTSVTLAGNTAIIGIGNWSIVSGAGGVFTDATNPTTVFSGTAGTTYVLRWTITNVPCVSTDDVTITFNQNPTVITVNPAAVCSPATIDLTAAAITSGSTGGLTFTYFTDALATLVYATPAAATTGTYYIVGTTGAGCTDTTPVTVIVNQSPVATATGTGLSCFNVCNGTAIATVTGGSPVYIYAWTTGHSDTTALLTDTIRGLCAQGYTVTVTDANGCTDTGAVILSQPAQINPNIIKTDVTCTGLCDGTAKAVPIGGTAPYTFSWSTGSIDSVITGLCAGTYTVNVTDFGGCSSTLTTTIFAPPPVAANAAITNATCGLCDGQAVLSPSGGVGPYTFLWGNGQVSNTQTNLCTGVYTVDIIDNIGCVNNFSVPISNPGGPTSSVKTSTNISCFGTCNGAVTSVIPSGGTPPYTYLWIQSGQTSQTINSLCAGVYFVQIADTIGCALIDSVTISGPSEMAVNQFVTGASCGLCDGSIRLTPSGGTGPYTLLWNNSSTSDTLVGLCAGFYTVQITDAAACTQSVVVPVSSQGGPVLTTSALTPILCHGSCNGSADVTAVGGTAPYSYLWSDPAHQINDTATALCAGTYFVQVTGGACVSFAAVIVTEPSQLGMGQANKVEPLCNGTSNGSITVVPTGGALPYSFVWAPPGSVTGTAANLAGGTYIATITDANGCVATQSNTLVNPPGLTISHTSVNPSCNTTADGSINETPGGGTPGYTYQWSGGSALTTQDLSNLLIGSYTITVRDTNGCSIRDSVTLASLVTITAKAGNDTTVCGGAGTMLLSAAGSSANVVNYHWFEEPNTLLGGNVTVLVTPSAPSSTYYVVVDNGLGCMANDTVVVAVNSAPIANAGPDVSVLLGAGTVIGGNPTGPAGATYVWSPITGLDNGTNSNPTANPTVTTTYTVTVTSAAGCVSTDAVVVTISSVIVLNDGITPNGDGLNDEWVIDNIDLFPKCVVEIYNRWGELLFQSIGYRERWNGTYKGQPLPIGTYYYIVDLKDPAFPDAYTGPVTIMR